MKIYIFGKSRGLGYELGQLFEQDGHQVIGFDRTTGFDIEQHWVDAVSGIEDDSLIILNAYANGCQKQILESLVNKKNKIVVMGSIASKYPDPTMPTYSNHKIELAKYFMNTAIEKKESDLLMLSLTGKSYQNSKLIYESIKFWLLNTDIIEFSYRTK